MRPVAQPRPSDMDHLDWLNRCGLTTWKDLRILDLGCGSGYLCEHFINHNAKFVLGVDLESPEFLKPDSVWKYASYDLSSKNWTTDLKNQHPGDYDLILAFDILEHLENPFTFLESCKTLLNSRSGKLVVTTPNTNSWERVAKPQTWSGATDPQHKILFSKYSLEFALTKAGLRVVELQAPVRKLKALSSIMPQIGGQILSVSVRGS